MSMTTRLSCLTSASLLITLSLLMAPGLALGQRYEPAAEDLALVAPILADRVDQDPERVVYVATLPGPDGDGSAASPRRDLITVVATATAGTAIHLAPGVYDMSVIRDEFGHSDSAIFTGEDGESRRPIVLRTDPELYDPGAGAVATLDFNYENDPSWRKSAFIARNKFWVFERFEMRRVESRGFWVDVNAHDNTFRELHLHHANTDGRNNEGLILMAASRGGIDNVVIGCHLHDVGNIDTATDVLIDRGFVNGGCFYSETRFTYDSGEPAGGNDASRAEWEAVVNPPDGDVYLIGNEVHDCHYGLGLKTTSRGPYYFLSNHIYDTDVGIFSPFSGNTVRNNVLRGTVITLGRSSSDSPRATFFKMTGNGSFSEVSYNTIIDGNLSVRAGWGTTAHHNLIVDSSHPFAVSRNQFYWWDDGAWPGIRGEFLIGDLDASNPFYDLVPGYMKETPGEFVRMRLTDNCYTAEPVIAATDFVQPMADITGMTFDEDYVVLTAAERAALFVDEAGGDYRRVSDDGFICGSRIGASTPLPMPDGGMPDGGMPDGGGPDASGPDGGVTPPGVDGGAGAPPASEGCGCATGQAPLSGSNALLLMLIGAVLGRRGRGRRRP